jgi:hypothetical protein
VRAKPTTFHRVIPHPYPTPQECDHKVSHNFHRDIERNKTRQQFEHDLQLRLKKEKEVAEAKAKQIEIKRLAVEILEKERAAATKELKMLTASELMLLCGRHQAAADAARDSDAIHKALGMEHIPHPPVPTHRAELRGPNLREWYRQWRRPCASLALTYSIDRIVGMEVTRQWDADDGDRTVLHGTLNGARSQQYQYHLGYAWGSYTSDFYPWYALEDLRYDNERTRGVRGLRQSWNDYHYKHQVILRAPLASSIRERDAIRVTFRPTPFTRSVTIYSY